MAGWGGSRAPLDLSGIRPRVVKEPSKSKGDIKNATKPFISWDGEAIDDMYCLFGASSGEYMYSPKRALTTLECLELIIETGTRHPDAFHIGFVFDYDVNNILRDLSFVHLTVLKKQGHVTWKGYEIHHVPSKIFKVRKMDAAGKKAVAQVRIDDVFSYFRARYDKVLIKYGVGTEAEQEQITAGKEARSTFSWNEIDTIKSYWQMELRLMVVLMDQLRKDFNDAGFYIGQWHGPGALAAYALKQHGSAKYKKKTPDELLEPARIAYSGGWFERFKAGMHDGPVYTADINSAYAYAFTQLPDLTSGSWEHIDYPDRNLAREVSFGLFRLRHTSTEASISRYFSTCLLGTPLPLFQRDSRGTVTHPIKVDGWYWNPEAKHVIASPDIEFVEAWVYRHDGVKPFEWVGEMYEERLDMKAVDNPAEKALKMTMASLYGRVAQRAGWRRTNSAPRWHQIEWAGWVTSWCRSMIFEASWPVSVKNGLVSIDTDGVISTVPFGELRNGVSDALGAWKIEEYSGLMYFQNGIYWLRNLDGEWEPPKMRGIPTRKMSWEIGYAALQSGGQIHIEKDNFVGYGAALHGRRKEWLSWTPSPLDIDIAGAGTRQHSARWCRSCRAGYTSWADCLHNLSLVFPMEYQSQPHKLPWLEAEDESLRDLIRHMIAAGEI
jgi:hypothetical protein